MIQYGCGDYHFKPINRLIASVGHQQQFRHDNMHPGERRLYQHGYSEYTHEVLLGKMEQAGRVPSKEKFRRMICFTCVSCGGCPYNDRCVFLHDPRIKIEGIKLKPTKQSRSGNGPKDSFYWPDMSKIEVVHKLDVQGLPDSNQVYKIPPNFACIPESSHHDRAIYSMWSHFVEKCSSTDLHTGVDSVKRNNRYLGSANRLPIFYNLSNATSLDGKDSPAEESFIRNPQSNRLSLNVHGEEQVRQVHQQNRSVTLQEASPMSVSELFSSHPGLELRPNFSQRPYYEGGRHSPCAYRSNEYEDFDHSGDRVPSQVHQHCYTTQKPSSRTSNNRLSDRQSAPNASMRSNSHFHPYTPSFNEFDGRTAPYYENTIHRGDASVRHSPYREHEHQYCSPQYSPLSVGGRYQGGNSGYPSPTSSLDHYQQHAASPYRLDSSDNTRQHYQFYDQQDQQQQSTAQPSHFQQPLSPASYAHFMEPSPLPCALRRSTSSEIGEVIPNTLSPCGAQNTFLSQQENIALGAVFDTWNDLQWCGDDVELVSIASADSHGSRASGSGADGGADIWNLQLVEPQECNDNSVNSADPTQHGDDIVQLDNFPWVHSQDTGY